MLACLFVCFRWAPDFPVFSFSKLPSREPAVSDAPCSQGSTLGSQALRSWSWACEKNHHEGRGHHVSLCVSQLRRFALVGKPFGMANNYVKHHGETFGYLLYWHNGAVWLKSICVGAWASQQTFLDPAAWTCCFINVFGTFWHLVGCGSTSFINWKQPPNMVSGHNSPHEHIGRGPKVWTLKASGLPLGTFVCKRR